MTDLPEREMDVAQLQSALELIGRLEANQRAARATMAQLRQTMAWRLVRAQHPGPLAMHEATVLMRALGAEPYTACNCSPCVAAARAKWAKL